MILNLQNFNTLTQNAAASVQASAAQPVDLSVGSVLRALLEANSSAGLWMQWLIVQVLQTTRAATSSGSDLDTWLADFGMTRLTAVPSTGLVTLARYTPAAAALVPVGAVVRTLDGSQSFTVTADTTNAAYSAAASGYVVPAGQASVVVPVAAEVAGSLGNVQAGAVALMVTPIPGIDTVTNASGFTSGLDAETDAAARARFQGFLDSRTRATSQAILYAVAGVQQGLTMVLQENTTPTGLTQLGNFVITIDDGSGAPSASLLNAVSSAVDRVRPIGSTFSVQGPQIVEAGVALSVTVTPAAQQIAAIAAVTTAVTGYVNSLAVGAVLSVTRIAQVVYTASSYIANVSGVTINGASQDLTPPAAGVIKLSGIAVN
jgi:uncharacterized phage protein gp47/JayE